MLGSLVFLECIAEKLCTIGVSDCQVEKCLLVMAICATDPERRVVEAQVDREGVHVECGHLLVFDGLQVIFLGAVDMPVGGVASRHDSTMSFRFIVDEVIFDSFSGVDC